MAQEPLATTVLPGGSVESAPGKPAPNALDSRLDEVADAREESGQRAALAEARADQLAIERGRIRVIVEARRGRVPQARAAVVAAGGRIEGESSGLIQALLPTTALEAVAAKRSVKNVRPPLVPEAVAVTGEGIVAANADEWQAAGVDASGVKVAVIDLGFDGLTESQARGDLPADVTTVDYCASGFERTVHGTAVAEIVYELAPGVELYLICVETLVNLAQAEQYAEDNDITVINHSVAWFNTSRGDGTGAPGTPDAIVEAARDAGILWINAAGNHAQRHWSGAFDDSDGDGFHNFTATNNGNGFLLFTGQSVCLSLKWDDWPGSAQDYDLFLVRNSDVTVVAASTNVQAGAQAPREQLCYTNGGAFDVFFASIRNHSATETPRFDLFAWVDLQYQTPEGSVVEPATSPNAWSVAALCWQDRSLEAYSSRGPTIDGRNGVDIAGYDAVSSGVYGGFFACGVTGFSGTSAAAPHAAAAAALLSAANPGFGPDQLEIYLEAQAGDLGLPGADPSYGAGSLDLSTAPSLPGANTGGADDVGETTAMLNGRVSPNGAQTSYYFEYGPDESYGSTTEEQSLDHDADDVAVAEALSGLVANQSYHFRLVATNVSGTTLGEDGVFTTAGGDPPPAPPEPPEPPEPPAPPSPPPAPPPAPPSPPPPAPPPSDDDGGPGSGPKTKPVSDQSADAGSDEPNARARDVAAESVVEVFRSDSGRGLRAKRKRRAVRVATRIRVTGPAIVRVRVVPVGKSRAVPLRARSRVGKHVSATRARVIVVETSKARHVRIKLRLSPRLKKGRTYRILIVVRAESGQRSREVIPFRA